MGKEDLQLVCLPAPAHAGDPSRKGTLQPRALAPGCSNVNVSVTEA